jgi:diguanylate cyclase (GGDEF)-like protein
LAVLLFAGLLPAGLLLAGNAAKAESAKELPGRLRTITKAREAHDLSSKEAARAYPVHLRAVVTYYDPNLGHGFAALFVNDATGGIYVRLPANTIDSLPTGTLVDVRGVSGNGSFAPYVEFPHVRVIGPSHLPQNAVRVTHFSLFSGADDGKWVEVEGTIHSVAEIGRTVTLQLAMTDGPISVIMMREAGADYSSLVDARVRIHANVAPLLSRIKFQMIGARLMAPDLSALKVLEPAPSDPFNSPTILIDNLLRWDQIPALSHRVHLRGGVTLQWPGSSLCIRDASGGICAQTAQETPLAAGDVADVIGFAETEGEAHVLTDAVYRRVGNGGPAAPAPLTAEEVLLGVHDSELIQIEGQLIGRDLASSDTTLMLTSGKFIFTAVLPQGMKEPETGLWKNGSGLRITGICSVRLDVQSSAVGEGIAVAKSFRVLMRSPADVVIVRKASWWTPVHAVLLLTFALIVTLLVLGWVAVLRKRIRESEERFRYMALHDALTGLATRVLFHDRLSLALEAAKRRRNGFALLMLDIDRFKELNDTFGHRAGDEVLRVTSARIVETARKSDTVARMGGDEFVVLLPDLGDPQGAESMASRVVAALSVPVSFEGRELPISVSVGVCTSSAGELDAEVLLKNADTALYEAKARGRNCFQVFAPNTAQVCEENAG